MPIRCRSKLYSCAVVLSRGEILGVVPKSNIPNYSEFYEARWFVSGQDVDDEITLCDQTVTMSAVSYTHLDVYKRQSITFISREYELQPYAMGVLEFPTPYSDYGSILKEHYLPCLLYTSTCSTTCGGDENRGCRCASY